MYLPVESLPITALVLGCFFMYSQGHFATESAEELTLQIYHRVAY